MRFQLFITRFDKFLQIARSLRLLKTLVYHRLLAGAEHREILADNLATVVDIGANRGQFVLAVRHWAAKARVIAFEPLAAAAFSFREVFDSDKQVILHQAAIGPKAGTATIHVAAADDSSSLLPISDLQEQLFPGTGEIRTETIRVGRLSDFVSAEEIVAPALLKLDVQGYELEALRACQDLLDRFCYVYAECSFVELYAGQFSADEVIAWLRKHQFRLSGVYNTSYDPKGKSVQADFLFENSTFAKHPCSSNTV